MTIHANPESVNNNSTHIEVSSLPAPPYQAAPALPPELDFYARHGAALFPLPAGSKAPGNADFWPSIADPTRAGSFKHEYSRDPLQWSKWFYSHSGGVNFGVVAFACGKKGWIIIDTDVKPRDGQTTEEAIAEASQLRRELFQSWGLDTASHPPHVSSARNGWHDYFAISDDSPIDPATMRQPDAIKGRINIRVIGYTIAAGSFYDGTAKGEESGHYQLFDSTRPLHVAPQALIDHCMPVVREASDKVGKLDFEHCKKLYQWLGDNRAITTDEQWRNAGMAARLEFGDAGLELWQILAQKLFNEPVDATNETRWRSFEGNGTTMNTIFKLAREAGWKVRVPLAVPVMFEGGAEQAAIDAANAAKKSNNSDNPAAPGAPAALVSYTGPLPKTEKEIEDEELRDTPFIEPVAPAQNGDDWAPPDYLINGILQRRYCYTITGQTDAGKTNIALLIAAHVADGRPLGNIEVEKGTVLYFAGENPEDVKGRWFALCREMGLDHKKTDVHFVYGVVPLSKTIARYGRHFEGRGIKLSLTIVDTVAAYFEGDKEDDNKQAGNHARVLRSLRHLPGGPCVLSLAHPTKGATTLEDMKPRGGSALLNEVDGNIGMVRNAEGTIIAAKVGKFRGNAFDPLHFGLRVITDDPHLVDTKGRQQTTVIAEPISYGEVQRVEEKADKDSDKVLEALCNGTGMINAEIVRKLGAGWYDKRVERALKALKTEKLATVTKRRWSATPKGQTYLNTVANAQPVEAPPLAPANLGPAGMPLPRMVAPPPMPPK
jgi:hypothetical protein